jgi:hypothetical protein
MRDDGLMTPQHPRWNEFLAKLDQAALCRNTTEHAASVLAEMGDLDVERSLAVLRESGGRCDCEIVYGLGARRATACAGA